MDKIITADFIRRSDVSDIRRELHLDYIFQATGSSCQWCNKRIALIAYFCDLTMIDKCLEYIKRLPKYIDIFIVTLSEDIAGLVKEKLHLQFESKVTVIISKDGGEIDALLVKCQNILMKYEYLGFVYDKKRDGNVLSRTVACSLRDLRWENTVKTGAYIENVIEVFEKEPYLGVLAPPPPYMSYFFKTGFMGWGACYEEAVQFVKQLKLECIMSREKPPFILEISFWCRTKALEPLFASKFLYENYLMGEGVLDNKISHVIERILPYVAQSQGYYSGVMMTAEYASLYISNYQYMIDEMTSKGIFESDYD